MGRQPGSFIIGIGLLTVGGWIIATRLGVRLAGIQYMWPAIIAVLGLACFTQYLFEKRKQGGLLFLGLSGLLIGVFLNLFTLRVGGLTWLPRPAMPSGVTTYNMTQLWPVIPLCLGFALLMLYLAEGLRQQSLLIPTYIFGGIGLFALPITLGIIQGPVFNQVIRFWPALIVLIVIGIIVQPRPPQQDIE